MPRPQRHRQLLDVAWRLLGTEGSDALSLGRLAEAAGVTKPVAYDHFVTREGLLAALYADYDDRQTQLFEARIDASQTGLHERAQAIAAGYIDCVLSQGSEIQRIVAALAGSPELLKVRRQYQQRFLSRCHDWLLPYSGSIAPRPAALWAILGAADALSEAVVVAALDRTQAVAELEQVIVQVAQRQPD